MDRAIRIVAFSVDFPLAAGNAPLFRWMQKQAAKQAEGRNFREWRFDRLVQLYGQNAVASPLRAVQNHFWQHRPEVGHP